MGSIIFFLSEDAASLGTLRGAELLSVTEVSLSSSTRNGGVAVGGLVPVPTVPSVVEVQLEVLPVKKASRMAICASRTLHVSLNSVVSQPQSFTISATRHTLLQGNGLRFNNLKCCKVKLKKLNSVDSVRERSISTERPPLVGQVSNRSPRAVFSTF
jgi:hypothetical protein